MFTLLCTHKKISWWYGKYCYHFLSAALPSIPYHLQAQGSLETQEKTEEEEDEEEREEENEGERGGGEERGEGEVGGGGGGRRRKEGEKRRRHCFKFFEPSQFPHQHNFGTHLLSLLLFILNKGLASYQSMILSLLYQFLSLCNAENFKNYFSAIFSALLTSNNALV